MQIREVFLFDVHTPNTVNQAFSSGAVAQLVERHVRNVEAVGSIPICSTKTEMVRFL